MNIKYFTPILILFSITAISQNTEYYHTYRTTDSYINLTEWRVDCENKGEHYIIETVDEQNRVVELRVMENDTLKESSFYDDSIIKFEYKQDTIIQHNMINDSTYSDGVEFGNVAKIVFVLKNNYVEKAINFINYDTFLNSEYATDPILRKEILLEKENNKNGIESDHTFVFGYYFSSVKYKGYLPIKKDFDIKTYLSTYADEIKDSKFSIFNSKCLYQLNQ